MAMKLEAADVAMDVTTDAVQLLGGSGDVSDYPVERMMWDAKITQGFCWRCCRPGQSEICEARTRCSAW
jgi:hypothetical protein